MLYNYDTLRIQDYINLYYYAGYRLEAVEINAEAWDGTQRLTLMVNNRHEADAYITGRHSFLTMYPLTYVSMGSTYDLSLMMRGHGSVYITHITLRLVR